MTSRQKQLLVLIILVSVVLRVLAALYLGNEVKVLPGTFDQISYHNLALRLTGGYGFTFGQPWWPATAANAPTSHWSFFYTGYLFLIYKIFGPNPLLARLIQAVLVGIFQPLLAFLIGKEVFGIKVGIVAAFITAFYSYFIYYAATLMTEPFYIVSILLCLWLAILIVRRGNKGEEGVDRNSRGSFLLALSLGLSLGVAVLLRQLFFLFIPFLLLWILWAGGKRQIINILCMVGVLAITILPFTIFNYARFHRIVLLNTNAGYALFWSNHPIYGTQFKPLLTEGMGTYQELIPQELMSLDEAALDQALLKRGIGFIVSDPVRYLLLSLSRIPPYFMFWPTSESGIISNIARVTSFGLFLPFMLYGLYRSIVSRVQTRQPVFLLYLFIIIYTLIHLLTWTMVRYRLPVDGVLLVFAALAVVDLLGRVPIFNKSLIKIES